MLQLPGIDVSNHQQAVDWPAVAASGQRFAFAKASEGVSYADPWFAGNWRDIAAAGIQRGAYHYALPSQNSAEREAAWFVSIVLGNGLGPGDMLALDMEDPDVEAGAGLLDWTLRWLRAVETATGVRPVLYSGLWYLGPHGLVTSALSGYPLWLAAYQDAPPTVPAGLTLRFWQHTSSGRVPGVAGNCDRNWFFGSGDELRAIGKAGDTPAVVRTTPDLDRIRALMGVAWGIANGLDGLQSPFAQQLRDVVFGVEEEVGLRAVE